MTKPLWAAALLAALVAMALLGKIDASDQDKLHERYCSNVAVWAAEEARGVQEMHRTGHPDFRGNAAEICPGLRPAD